MPKSFVRCEFMAENDQQCEIWFDNNDAPREKDDSGNYVPFLCPDHSGAPSITTNGQKLNYVQTVNQQREYCYKMSLDDLDIHIARIEKTIEDEKVKLYAARAVREDKIQKLSDDERNVRRKIKVITRPQESPKVPAITLKNNPEQYMANKLGDNQKAKDLLSMDPDEFIAKYRKAKEKKGEQTK